jgi:hypothetical protein
MISCTLLNSPTLNFNHEIDILLSFKIEVIVVRISMFFGIINLVLQEYGIGSEPSFTIGDLFLDSIF